MTYPEAEIVVAPCFAILLHSSRCGGVAQVMVPTDKHQRDGRIYSLQGCLQVPLLTLSEWGVWKGKGAGRVISRVSVTFFAHNLNSHCTISRLIETSKYQCIIKVLIATDSSGRIKLVSYGDVDKNRGTDGVKGTTGKSRLRKGGLFGSH